MSYYRNDDGGFGCFGALLALVFITAILVTLAYFAFVVFSAILLAAVLIAALVGTIITLKNYIVALYQCIQVYRRVPAPATWKLPSFLFPWQLIVRNMIIEGWKSNVNTVKVNFQRGCTYKFIGVRRWFYWFISLSTIIFGVFVTGFVIAIQLSLIGLLLAICVALLLAFICVSLIAAIGFSFFLVCRNGVRVAKHAAKQLCSGRFSEYVAKYGFKNFFACVALIWKGTSVGCRKAINNFKLAKIISFEKWMYFFQVPFIYVVTALLTPLIVVVGILVQAILFLVFNFIALLKR